MAPGARGGVRRAIREGAGLTESGRVVVIGDALIDELRDETGCVSSWRGGAQRRGGADPAGGAGHVIAMVGDDEAGGHIRAYLDDFGVDLVASASPLGTSRAVSIRSAGGEPEYEFNHAARRAHPFGEAERAAIAEAAS